MNRRTITVAFGDLPAMPAELLLEFADAGCVPGDTALSERGMLGTTPLRVDLWLLARFKQLMAAEGRTVHAARMIFDRIYAHERLAVAHSSASESLRRLALELFTAMHALDGATGELQH